MYIEIKFKDQGSRFIYLSLYNTGLHNEMEEQLEKYLHLNYYLSIINMHPS